MTIKEQLAELIKGVKQKFSVEPPAPPAPAPTAMNKYTLADGTEVEIEALEVGKPVMVGGNPAPEGSHTLQDGTVITVDAAGVITDIKAAPMPSTPAEMQAALAKFAEAGSPDMQKLVTIVKAMFENVFGWEIRRQQEEVAKNQAIEIYKTGFSTQKDELKALTDRLAKAEAVNKDLFAAIELLCKEPEVQPLQKPQGVVFSADGKVQAENIIAGLKAADKK